MKKDRYRQMADALTAWYPEHARDLPWRRDKDPYHVWLSEIMLQQTRVEAVREYYRRFLAACPGIKDLSEIDDDRLMKLWEGLGYYNRARNLKRTAIRVMTDYDGIFPCTYEEILALPGIGAYTAGAIGSICFDLPTPAVDGNVLRVYTRVTEDASVIDRESVKCRIREELAELYACGDAGLLTQSLMEVGAVACLPNGAPKCETCPLAACCGAYLHGTWQQYPVRAPKKKRRIENRAVFLILCDGRVAVRKREEKGLLHGLWEFPNIEGVYETEDVLRLASERGVHPREIRLESGYTHIFSHVEWRMRAYVIECAESVPEYVWVTPEELEHDVALPSAFRPFAELLFPRQEP